MVKHRKVSKYYETDCSTYMHGLAVYVKERIPFARDLSLEKSAESYLCFRLAYFAQCLTSFSSIDHLLRLCAWLLILFHLTYMRFSQSTLQLICFPLETLTSIIRTGLPILVELMDLVNSVIIFLSQTNLLRWLTFLLVYHSALLDLFISSDASICSTMAFPSLGNSDHVVVSVSIDFPSYPQRDAPFHRIAYDYSRAD